jgi:hypothetical protein
MVGLSGSHFLVAYAATLDVRSLSNCIFRNSGWSMLFRWVYCTAGRTSI